MNVKNNVKKIVALGASVALVGMTLAGAVAYDLSDYPAPFVENGVIEGQIVVGHNAMMADMLGAIDIAASLQANAVTTTDVVGTTAVALEGGEEFTVALSTAYPSSAIDYDDADLEGFMDEDIEINDKDIDVKEHLVIKTSAINVETSSETNYDWEDGYDYDSEAYMEIAKSSIQYYINFSEGTTAGVNFSDVADDFEIDFLGKKIKIVNADTNKITVEASAENFMIEGDMVTVDGHDVTLVRVGESSVIVEVDGQTKVISYSTATGADNDAEFDQADDFEVEVDSIFYDSGATDNGANLILGQSITDVYTTGEALEIFDGNDDEDTADWLWDITTSGTRLISVGIINSDEFDYKKLIADDDDERVAFAMGEELVLPNNYAAIEFAAWDDADMAKFDTLEISFGIENLENGTGATLYGNDKKVVIFESSAEEAFVVGSNEYDSVVVAFNDATNRSEIYYEDDSDWNYGGTGSFKFILGDETHPVTITPPTTAQAWAVNFDGVEELKFNVTSTVEGFLENSFVYTNTSVSEDDEEDLKTPFGTYFKDMEGMFEDDEIILNVPHMQQKAQIVVKSQGTVTSAAAGGVTQVINPASLGLAIEDIDAPTLGNKPLIVVGGPAINTVAAELMGNPTQEQIAASFEAGKAMIKFYGDKNAVLVAGYEAMETQGACNVLADYQTYDLSGDEMEVIVTDVNNVEVSPVME